VVQIANPSTVADGNFLVTCFCMVGSLLVSEDVIDP